MTIFAQDPYRRIGGTIASTRSVLGIKNVTMLAPFAGGFTKTNSLPTGWRHGNGWFPAQSDETVWHANLGRSDGVTGDGGFATSGALGLNAEAAISGSGTISTAALGLIVSAVASMLGAGDISASARGRLDAAASLSGTGGLTGAVGAVAGLVSAVIGSGSLTAAVAATGSMSASITVSGDMLSTTNVAAAVWNALSTSMNLPGTMGAKLNSAAAAGDPWSADLPGTYPPGSAGAILGGGIPSVTDIRQEIDANSTQLAALEAALTIVQKILRNKTVTDPVTGVMTVYDDDGTNVLFSAQLYENTAETQPYRGQGAEVRERLE